MKGEYIGILIPATLTQVIAENILVLMMVEVDIVQNNPATLPLAIREQEFMLKVEVDIGLRQDTLSPITQVTMVDLLLHQHLIVL